ncbi:glycoside hydrolase [Massarina eburnea CBS 473.64]|uniref:Alpha-galactosidase n=1 Tax=Massarina eburnea CBS 473.64 TaxID=1395130 RepID=A0A6A6S3I3_9PLEO|nr:glycoside hydrolase [Massarina eburnea CBS 473.64]
MILLSSIPLCLLLTLTPPTFAKTSKSPTPPMGWNSYNSYSCSPSEAIVKLNAQGLVDYGLDKLGYDIVTPDCGWPAKERDAQGRLVWNESLFPSGGRGLGDWLHGKGLRFGGYSGGGWLQCGSTDLPASLGHEDVDAQTFADWNVDTLKYDNCYSTSNTTMVDSTSSESKASTRFQRMAQSLEKVSKEMQYFVCQWGIGEDVGTWASEIGNTWRMSNDIYNAWRSIWRITNQVAPYWRNTKPGAFPDMDMLLVGLNVLSPEEERFHFGMWALNKSPLILGAILDSAHLSASSLAIISNKEVISIDQDDLGKQTRLVRRYTEEEYDIWLGDLSGSRKVLGLANWKNAPQAASIDLKSLGILSAKARDVWGAQDLGVLNGTSDFELEGHELKLLILSNIVDATPLSAKTYYAATDGTLSGGAQTVTCASTTCLPTHRKVGNITPGSSITFTNITTTSSSTHFLGIDFINYDYAFETAWGWGDNTRNLTISVNGGKEKRWAFPLSGGNWEESGRLEVETTGWKQGSGNTVVFRGVGGSVEAGVGWAPDLVGFEVLE